MKDEFLRVLSSRSPEEINQYIEQKGKKKKLISAIIFYDPAADPLYEQKISDKKN